MLQTLKKAWSIPDLRRKMFYTIMLIIVFRLGAVIPVPFVDASKMASLVAQGQASGSLIGFLDTFSGGAFAKATIFAMSITPYINASIIMQLLTVAIPALERLNKEGEIGRKKINQITRYLTVVLGFIQAGGLYLALNTVSTERSLTAFLVMTLTFTAGTAFLMWLGEQINEKGIGNGISLIIFAGIISRGPQLVQSIVALWQAGSMIPVILILIVGILIIAAVVFMNDSERRIQVQYAKRVVGRKMYGGQATHIPIKLLSAGVIPIIFAMSILAFPTTLGQFFGVTATSGGFMGWLMSFLSMNNWPYAILYFLLVIFFTYFYTAIQFNTDELANNIKGNGGFIPGIRPGRPTKEHIDKILHRVTLAGAVFLALIAVIPIIVSIFAPSFNGLAFGGTSVLIVVGVAIETTKQFESQMLVRNYKGFLE